MLLSLAALGLWACPPSAPTPPPGPCGGVGDPCASSANCCLGNICSGGYCFPAQSGLGTLWDGGVLMGGYDGGATFAGGDGGAAAFCAPCTTSADCGGNNFCLMGSNGVLYCGLDCSGGQSCPAGSTCQEVYDSNNVGIGKNCEPDAGHC